MAVATFTKSGTKATTAAILDKKVFGEMPKNNDILKLAYRAYLANGRENLARTKTRGEVSGGGKKPWRQKGTGRARFGSSRVPIWRGGGVVFGPTGFENYSKKVPLQIKRSAIRQALSLAASTNSVVIIEDLVIKDAKTSTLVGLLEKMNLHGRLLLAVAHKTPELERAVANLQKVQIVSARYLNTYDILNADAVLLTVEALQQVHEWLGNKK